GHLWLALQIKAYYESRLNYVWYGPTLLAVVVVFLSPLLVCGFFVRQLFKAGELVLAFVYSGLLVPCLMLFLLLAGTVAILGLAKRQDIDADRIMDRLVDVLTALQNQPPADSK